MVLRVGGCTNCGGKTGCDSRKGVMFEAVDAALEALYPSKTWGEPDDEVRFWGGVSSEDCGALAEEFAIELQASSFYRPGDDSEYCDYIYVLCVGREPSLVQIRDGEVPVPEELHAQQVTEQYLRVCVSAMARMAAVQQVSMVFDPASGTVVESARPGVYDAPLLHRLQRLVAILPAYDITHVDFGEISASPPGFDAGNYAALYGGEPHLANYLFYPQPTTTCITTSV